MDEFTRVKKSTTFEGIDTLTKVSVDKAHGPYDAHVDVVTWVPGAGLVDKRRIDQR